MLEKILANPEGLKGTDLKITLPLDRTLLNEVLAARPADTPVEELFVDPDPGNQLHLHLAATAPVIGLVRRRITFVPGPAVSFPDNPWLQLDIVDGFKFLDKPLIKLMQGQLEKRLPKGIELTGDYLRLHVPALMTAAGYQQLVPMVDSLRLQAIDNKLVVELQIKH